MAFPRASTALERFTVLDLTRVRAGPTAARQLAAWGANVIKVELPAAQAGGAFTTWLGAEPLPPVDSRPHGPHGPRRHGRQPAADHPRRTLTPTAAAGRRSVSRAAGGRYRRRQGWSSAPASSPRS